NLSGMGAPAVMSGEDSGKDGSSFSGAYGSGPGKFVGVLMTPSVPKAAGARHDLRDLHHDTASTVALAGAGFPAHDNGDIPDFGVDQVICSGCALPAKVGDVAPRVTVPRRAHTP